MVILLATDAMDPSNQAAVLPPKEYGFGVAHETTFQSTPS